jgi:hypothetical protein
LIIVKGKGKHNRSEMVAVLGPYEALPYYIHTKGKGKVIPVQVVEALRVARS